VTTATADKKIMLPVFSMAGVQVGEVEASAVLFGAEVSESVLREATLAYLNNQREGNAHSKERGEVAGSTKKLFRQKGTGRARVGSSRSPTRVHGGTVFGPRHHDFRVRLPKKVRRAALCSALSARTGAGEVRVLDAFRLEGVSTKTVAEMLKALGLTQRTLMVCDQADDTLLLSTRNIEKLQLARAQDLNAYEVLLAPSLLFTREGLTRIQEAFASSTEEGGLS
jgi:large subunit ribosomal protein L4